MNKAKPWSNDLRTMRYGHRHGIFTRLRCTIIYKDDSCLFEIATTSCYPPQVLLLGHDEALGGLLEDNREILEECKDFKLTVAIEQ